MPVSSVTFIQKFALTQVAAPGVEPGAVLPVVALVEVDGDMQYLVISNGKLEFINSETASKANVILQGDAQMNEAKFSFNLKLKVKGFTGQLTVREDTEAELIAAVNSAFAILQKWGAMPDGNGNGYAAPHTVQPQAQKVSAPPAQQSAKREAPICPDHGVSKLSKDNRTYFCPTKVDDGWCPWKSNE